MKKTDRDDYIGRYEGRLKEFGYDPRTLGWGNDGRQAVRFGVLAEEILQYPQSSVLDVGCGFADLFDYLIVSGWRGSYTGIDIVPGLLDQAKVRHPELRLLLGDITNPDEVQVERHDYVVASGVLNAALPSGENENHIKKMLAAMYDLSDICVCCDFMSTHVDFQKEGAWHTDPAFALATGMKHTNRVKLRHDYMPFEFSLFLYRANKISPRRIFESHARKMSGMS